MTADAHTIRTVAEAVIAEDRVPADVLAELIEQHGDDTHKDAAGLDWFKEEPGPSFIEGLRASCEYDPEADGSVDDLIGYKDALEDRLGAVEHDLRRLLRAAENAKEHDDDYWAAMETGQDSEEAEASGGLAGQVAGLGAALALVYGKDNATSGLDLYIDPRRLATVEAYRERLARDLPNLNGIDEQVSLDG
jgi:hypothetical protein